MSESDTTASNKTGFRLALGSSAMLFLFWFSAPAGACDVPVFRYALERWPAEYFNVLVFHRGKLTGERQAVADWLAGRADDASRPCNVAVTLVDVQAAEAKEDSNAAMPEAVAALWESQKDKPLPRMVACFPSPPGRRFVAWSGDFSAAAARALVDSPARRKVVEAIAKGDSAVWLLVECGDRSKDAAALAMLQEQLARLAKAIALPEDDDPDVPDVDEDAAGPKVRIGFSVVRVSRDESAESALVGMLMSTEPDLAKEAANEPAAFAVFGQGRTLWALVGKGINKSNIEEYTGFLCGPCSCQVKSQNPGVDLLFAADWFAPFRGAPQVTAPLPDVIGAPAAVLATVATTQPAGASASPTAMAALEADAPRAGGTLLRNMLIALVAIVAAGAVLALWVSRRAKETTR